MGGLRLDRCLSVLIPGISRTHVVELIRSGAVRIGGALAARPSQEAEAGQTVEVELRERASSRQAGPARALHVVFEDAHMAILDKPPGVLAHPTGVARGGTISELAQERYGELPSLQGADRPGIVHRLDAGTSGLMLVAKTDEAHEELVRLLAAREIEREYLALVRGVPPHEDFAVEAPLERRGTRVRVRRGGGAEAETAFAVAERLQQATLLTARPRTGRTHQIRAHLSSIGHPILGDRAYGGGGDDAKRLGLTRPFLHARRLALTHPITGERLEVEEPLPEDLEAALTRARAR